MLSTAPAPSAEDAVPSNQVVLHVEHFDALGSPRLVALLVHGLGLHCGLYRHVARALAEHGITATLFDCRGHGLSQGPRGHADAFSDYLGDLNQIVELVHRRSPGVPVALIGHSFGGLVVLSHALEAHRDAACVVAVSPWLDLNLNASAARPRAIKVFRRLRPALPMDNFVTSLDLSRDPAMIAAFDSDPLIHHSVTAGSYVAILEQQAQLRSASARIEVPTLVLWGQRDQVVSIDAAASFLRRAAVACDTRQYSSLGHGLFFEPEWRTVVADVAEWLRAFQKSETPEAR
jgi:lysophospholipase